MCFLLQREAKAGCAVLKHRAGHAKRCLIQNDTIRDRNVLVFLSREPVLEPEKRRR
jgi:hypothetical protein